MRSDEELGAALNAWRDGEYFPYAAIRPRGELEFDFCGPADDAIAAAPVWIYDDPDIIADIVCWELGDPERFWIWDRARHPVIGGDYLGLCRDRNRPARLVATPREWFESVGTACCVLDWNADLRAIFGDVAVECADEAMERKYARAFRWKPQRARIHRG